VLKMLTPIKEIVKQIVPTFQLAAFDKKKAYVVKFNKRSKYPVAFIYIYILALHREVAKYARIQRFPERIGQAER